MHAHNGAGVELGRRHPDTNVLPLTLIARYLDRYGIRRRFASPAASPHPATAGPGWLTVVADDNLAALQARSHPCKRPRRSRRACKPSAREKSVGRLVRRTRRAPSVGGCGFSRDVAECGTPTPRCGISGQRRCRVADFRCPRSVASGARRPGSRWKSHMPPGHQPATRWPRLRELRTDWRPGGTTGGKPAPATRKPRASLTALDPRSTRRLDGHAAADLLTRLRWLLHRRRHGHATAPSSRT